MNGPEHYTEGERRLQEACDHAETEREEQFHLGAAQAHFLAASAAILATAHHPHSLSWQEALKPRSTE